MPKKSRRIPEFGSEAAERAFWELKDSTEYVHWSNAERVRLPNLKPSTQSISLRLPIYLLERIRIEAHKRDIPYQSLIKHWLSEKAEGSVGLVPGSNSVVAETAGALRAYGRRHRNESERTRMEKLRRKVASEALEEGRSTQQRRAG